MSNLKTSSAKAKGRKLQQWFAQLMVDTLKLHEEDLESRPMGSQGEDIIMGRESRSSPTLLNARTKKQLMYGKHMNKLQKIVKDMNH